FMTPLPPLFTLFPYTTLFRSIAGAGGVALVRGCAHDWVRAHARTGHTAVAPRAGVAVVAGRAVGLGGIAAGACRGVAGARRVARSEEHTSELQSRSDLVCRLL